MTSPSAPPSVIGVPPWTSDEIRNAAEEFERVYEKRPFRDNRKGMGTSHLLATWFIIRHLKPATVIESGIWKGMGTWMIEQASPESQIISIDPNLAKRIYISPKVTYHSIDFSEIDWSGIDPAQALVFFDDHQNAYNRLILCRWFGFRRIIFEDNYPGGQGDFYTLRHIFEGAGFGSHLADDKARDYSSFRGKLTRFLRGKLKSYSGQQNTVIPQYSRDTVAPNTFDRCFLRKNLETYSEFPPAFRNPNQPHTVAPLFQEEEQAQYPLLYSDRTRYKQICYVELKPTVGCS